MKKQRFLERDSEQLKDQNLFGLMEKPKCGICSKVFSNGRALGGHMRAHLVTLPIPPKTEQHSTSSLCNSSNSSQYDDDEEEERENEKLFIYGYGLRENPKRSFKLLLVDPDDGLVVQDRESETEAEKTTTTRNPTRKRSKRVRKNLVLALQAAELKKPSLATELEPVSSVSNTSPEEDVAMCLMMLSRDVWSRSSGSVDSVELKPSRLTRGKYQCETCNKVFKSFQALGGHRTSHKKTINNCFEENKESVGKNKKNVSVKLHECPFCYKVFRSGQALGGHKRSHVMSSSTAATPNSNSAAKLSLSEGTVSLVNSSKLVDHLFIDLNLPAPMEEEEGEEDQDFLEFSAVSDAEEFMTPSSYQY